MDISLTTGVTAGVVLGLLGIIAAVLPKPQKKLVPIKSQEQTKKRSS